MLAFDLAPPAISRSAEPWEARLRAALERDRIPIGVQLAIVAELKRLQGMRHSVLRPALEDLVRFGGLSLGYLPGMTGAVSSVGGGKKFTLEFITATYTSNGDIDIPAGAQSGDLCVTGSLGANTTLGQAAPTIPSADDFTILDSERRNNGSGGSQTGQSAWMTAKILDGTETIAQGMGGNTKRTIASIFRPSAPLASFTPSLFNVSAQQSNVANLTCAASGVSAPCLVVGCMLARTGTASGSVSPTMTSNSPNALVLMHYLISNEGDTPVNITTYDMDSSPNSAAGLGVLALTPA
jgi:hypothetical protein